MDSKVEKKLAKLASNIKKSRKDKKKEAAQFEEINRLLKDSDEDDIFQPKDLEIPPEMSELQTKDILPLAPPSIQVFDEKKLFLLFDENTLKLETFLKYGEKSCAFGKEVHLLSDNGVRKMILHENAEGILADTDKCQSISLYVFYLLSVHSNPKFVQSCFEFLKKRRFTISSDEILSVFVNFGSTIEELCDSSFEIDLPEYKNPTEKIKKYQFPLANAQMVAKFLIHCVDNNLVNFDWHFKHLMRALVKIALDLKIKNGGLYTLYSTLVAKLAVKAVENYGSYDVINWLHLDSATLPVQVEVCWILGPVDKELQQELIIRILDFIFNPKNLNILPPMKFKDLKRVLEETKKKVSSLLDTYYLLQLMLIVLPTIDVTLKESHEINALLASLEGKILRKDDSTDVVRIKLDMAKMRNLIICKRDNRFAMNECIQLSPDKTSKKGAKRLEFFETQIKKYKGEVVKAENAEHVVIEEAMSENREKCLSVMKTYKINVNKDVKYLTTKWLSKCFADRVYGDVEPFRIKWISEGVISTATEKECVKKKSGESSGEDTSPKKQKLDEKKFLCTQSSSNSDGGTPVSNQKIITELQKLADAYRIRNDTWRHFGYSKAIRAITNYNKPITSFNEASNIPGIGDKMARKIMEILESGKLKKVDEICNDEKTITLDLFCKIWGVGPSTAENWYRQGFRTLEELREKAKLTKQQSVGLKYFDDIQKRIPREEVVEIGKIVETEMTSISSTLKLELVGSFRRGKSSCGDIDLMLINPGFISNNDILVQLIEKLKTRGYITDDLVALEEEGSHRKYMGMIKLLGENNINRRIDIFVVPESEYAAALMHYTGSAMFNRSIRLLAAKKDMTLTERGLFTGVIRKGSDVINEGQLLPTPTEHDIFNALGLDYKLPEERDH